MKLKDSSGNVYGESVWCIEEVEGLGKCAVVRTSYTDEFVKRLEESVKRHEVH